MRYLHLIPYGTKLPFMRWHRLLMAISAVLILGSIGLAAIKGLNYGIEFRGGILIELRTAGPADFSALREKLGALNVGEFSLQAFGGPSDVLIRMEAQEGGERANLKAIQTVREAIGQGVEFRRVETVGPVVGEEMRRAALWAILGSVGMILVYVWFRFEWQFGVGAVVALIHDVTAIIGLFSFFSIEFELSTLAAILTIGGYSINDTVVVYDRIRENLRKFKRMDLRELIDRSINETLSRTVITSFTVFMAVLVLIAFGGPVIRNFCIAMLVGVVIGTYSSIFIAAPVLIYLKLKRGAASGEGGAASSPTPAKP